MATCVVTGTVLTTATRESAIVTGGATVLLTLTGDTWVAAGGTFDGQRQNIINGCTSAQSETHGWNNEVKAKIAVTDVVRTSNTVVTITLDAESAYNITATDTITVTVPSTALTGGVQVVASPTFSISVAGGVVTLFSDGFETNNFLHTENGISWIDATNCSVTTAVAKTGTHSALFDQASGLAELRWGGVASLGEIYIQYQLWMPDGTGGLGPKYSPTGTLNDKFIRVWGNNDADYEPGTGNADKVGMSTYGDGGGVNGVIAIENCLSPDTNPANQWSMGRALTTTTVTETKSFINDANRGRWVKIGIHVKAATSANTDGVFQMYVDDVLLTGYTTLQNYPFGVSARHLFTNGYLFGAQNNTPVASSKVYVDDFTISTGGFP